MHARSEQMADYIADRLEFITFLACCSALLALLTGMSGQQALAFTALNLPFGLGILLAMAMLAPPARPLAAAGHHLAAGRLRPDDPATGGRVAQSAGHLEPLRPARAGDHLASASPRHAGHPRSPIIRPIKGGL